MQTLINTVKHIVADTDLAKRDSRRSPAPSRFADHVIRLGGGNSDGRARR